MLTPLRIPCSPENLQRLRVTPRIFLGRGGHLAQQRSDLAVPALGGVLVAHRRLRCGVTETRHQLGQAGASRRGQHRAGMAQIVPAQIGPARGIARLVPMALQRRRLQVSAVIGREDQRITMYINVFRQMVFDGRDDVRRDRHVADPGVGLRAGGRVALAGAHRRPPDADHFIRQVDVTAAQLDGLTEPQRTAYLAKYTTKSVAEFGIAARRISPAAIGELNIPAHTRRILSTLAKLATLPGNAAMLGWLHTLGYRGHITTKSRRYSVTMTALRAARHHWRARRADKPEPVDCPSDSHNAQRLSSIDNELSAWRIDGAGLRDDGERLLVHTAARQARQQRYLARLETRDRTGASP